MKGKNILKILILVLAATLVLSGCVSAPVKHRVCYLESEGGSVYGASLQLVETGGNTTEVYVVADDGYSFVGWSDGVTSERRQDCNITADLTVTALFAKNSVFDVKYLATEGGYLLGFAEQKVEKGQDSTQVTAVAKVGYKFVGWSDGVASESRFDANVSANITVTAQFEEIVYCNIVYLAEEGGYLVGATNQRVESGSDCTQVTAVPNEGFQFAGWSDGVTSETRWDIGVLQDKTVTAMFDVVKSYGTISYTANNYSACDMRGEVVHRNVWLNQVVSIEVSPMLGYRFVSWSDGNKSPYRTDIFTGKDLELQAIFEIDAMDFPVISIHTENSSPIYSKEVYVNCSVSVFNADQYNFQNASARIRGRGNSTWDFPKKPYKLKFDSKTNMFGFGKAKSWVLLANYVDPSLVRNDIALSLGALFESQPYTSKFCNVDLYINGEYCGVYMLCEQVETGTNRVNISEQFGNTDTGYLVELDARAPNEGVVNRDYVVVDGLNYAIKTPDTEDAQYNTQYATYIKNYLQLCTNTMRSRDWAAITQLMDVQSFAESYVMNEIVKTIDVGYASFYMYKDQGGKLRCGPFWDYDISMGNCDYGPYYYKADDLHSARSNAWFVELLRCSQFQTLVKEVLAKYRTAIWNTVNNEIEKVLSQEATFERNFQKWPTLGTYVWPNPTELVRLTTWRAQVVYVKDWLTKSINYVYSYYKV